MPKGQEPQEEGPAPANRLLAIICTADIMENEVYLRVLKVG